MIKILPLVAIFIFLGLTSSAYAKTDPILRPQAVKMASRAAEIKAVMREKQQVKLQQFRDQKKAKRVEQISDSLNKINQRHVEQMTKHLIRMTELLAKVEANAKTTAAQTAIQTAQDAVEVQKAKDYTITVSSETGVQVDAKRDRENLRTDLQNTNKLLKEAKQALIAAIREGAK